MVKEKWMVYSKKAEFYELAKKFHISPVTARVIRNRDIILEDDYDKFLNGNIDSLYNPFLLKDMEKATDILLNAIEENKNIRVIGDYDIDGICSTYILTNGISLIGGNVTMDIPDRIKDGYGINEAIIKKAKNDNIDLLITCDNGIAAIEEIKVAKELGMMVIVTDHHQVPFDMDGTEKVYKRVCADAVVNHKQPDCEYPFKELCGAAITYRFMMALYFKLQEKNDERAGLLKSFEDEMIQFAAIATIGDVVSLTNENRIIAKEGLRRIPNTSNYGLRSLLRMNELENAKISSFHIGFIIGPCLNATGRLESAKKGYKLLCATSEAEADVMAAELVELNKTRKDMTKQGELRACELAEQYADNKVLVIYIPDVHESIAGIVAGRIREKYNKPTIVLTDGEDMVKGSGRSIEGYDMYDGINECSYLLERFGGHTMAAGMSLKKENVDKFRESLNEKCELTEEDFVRKVWIDVPMPISYITEELIEDLSNVEPFGKDNEKPVFAIKDVTIQRMNLIGANRDIAKMTIVDNGNICTGMMFTGTEDFFMALSEKYDEEQISKLKMGIKSDIKASFTYYPVVNEFRGNKSLQINITGFIV